MRSVQSKIFKLVYNDTVAGGGGTDTVAGGGGTDTVAGGGGTDTVAGGNAGAKTYTQDELNKMMAENKRNLQKQNEQYAKQLEDLKKNQNLSLAEKDKLQEQIDSLRTAHLSEQEKSKREKERLEKEYTSKLDETTKKASANWERYQRAELKRAISDAAVAEEGFNPDQFVTHLIGNAKLVVIMDPETNQPTDEYEPKIKYRSVDKDGKTITLELSPREVVKRMREDDQFANFFKSNATGGVGQKPTKTPGKTDLANISPADYRKIRKQLKTGN